MGEPAAFALNCTHTCLLTLIRVRSTGKFIYFFYKKEANILVTFQKLVCIPKLGETDPGRLGARPQESRDRLFAHAGPSSIGRPVTGCAAHSFMIMITKVLDIQIPIGSDRIYQQWSNQSKDMLVFPEAEVEQLFRLIEHFSPRSEKSSWVSAAFRRRMD